MRWRDFDNLAPLPNSFFNEPRCVHFIGIGGIGMSALAFVLASRGHMVSGSDANESAMLEKLRAAGVLCAVGHDATHLELSGKTADAVIFGSAISPDNPEYSAAIAQGISLWHRAQLLAYFVNNAKFSIAVSGTHGKSTTSAMIAHILYKTGKNPTAILGAEYPPFGSNARIGDEDLIVVEADESDGSFTLLKPSIAVVTNVEPEHLENYENDENELWRAFKQFITQAKFSIVNADDKQIVNHFWEDVQLFFGLICDHACDLRATDIAVREGRTYFDLIDPGAGHNEHLGTHSLTLPGRHNISNALAAICAAHAVFRNPGNDDTWAVYRHSAQVLADFYGVKRRFQKIGEANGVLIYDDYAHHPTEVESTLRAAEEFLNRPVCVIFQPHRYSRTQQLGKAFGPSLEAADKVIITQLYSAFEEPIAGVSGRIVFDAARVAFPEKAIYYAENLAEAKKLALEIIESGDALFTMGAGDVSTLAPQLLNELNARASSLAPHTSNLEPLSKHTTMKIGGAVKLWLEPQSEEELTSMLQQVARSKMPLCVLGAGSNVIALDEGFEGAVVHLGKSFGAHRVEENKLIAGGAAMLPKLTHFALENNLGNFEWACGVPGSVGGSIWGNAGARGWNGKDFESRDCAADLESLVAFERDGTRRVLARSELEFSYRKSSLSDLIVTQATFALRPLNDEETQNRREAVKELLARRRATQPVNAACSGCIWKNPKIMQGEYSGCGAGALIEKLGLKNLRIGGAKVSEIHGNFIVNEGGATSRDVFDLIKRVEDEVLGKTGVKLEREVRIIGNNQ
jgi:UDP-N-acetylmuramate--alanine ligase